LSGIKPAVTEKSHRDGGADSDVYRSSSPSPGRPYDFGVDKVVLVVVLEEGHVGVLVVVQVVIFLEPGQFVFRRGDGLAIFIVVVHGQDRLVNDGVQFRGNDLFFFLILRVGILAADLGFLIVIKIVVDGGGAGADTAAADGFVRVKLVRRISGSGPGVWSGRKTWPGSWGKFALRPVRE